MELIYNLIAKNHQFVNCFEIYRPGEDIIYLTSGDKAIHNQSNIYTTYSGLKLEYTEFNDAGHDKIRLSGIFESQGISEYMNLNNSYIKIYFYFPSLAKLILWQEMSFGEIEHDNMQFLITLYSVTFKLHQNLLQKFSTTCRTNFGSNKCKVKTTLYSAIYDVVSVENNKMKISGNTKPDKFFIGGKAQFANESEYYITDHMQNIITLDRNCVINLPIRVTITPGCDKNFITCCNRYNNAINFRGEPHIPWN